jgi:hypothetical protein
VGFNDAATETTIEKILINKDSFDGKGVSVSGIVSKIKFRTSKGETSILPFHSLKVLESPSEFSPGAAPRSKKAKKLK